MRPVTESIPKCLVDINGKPLLEHQILYLRDRGYTSFIFCIAHLAQKVKDHFGDGTTFGIHILYSEEREKLLGTAGAVGLARDTLTEPFIVFFGDVLISLDFDDLVKEHIRQNRDFTAVVRELPIDYAITSLVTLDKNHTMTTFIDMPTKENYTDHAGEQIYGNNGVYVVNPSVFVWIAQNTVCDFAKDIIPQLLKAGKNVGGYICNDFKEFGRLDKYGRFVRTWRGKDVFVMTKKNKAIFLEQEGVVIKKLSVEDSVEQIELMPGIVDAIKKINGSTYFTFIAVREHHSHSSLAQTAIENRIQMILENAGASVEGFFICSSENFPGDELVKKTKKEFPYVRFPQSWIVCNSPVNRQGVASIGMQLVILDEKRKLADIIDEILNT